MWYKHLCNSYEKYMQFISWKLLMEAITICLAYIIETVNFGWLDKLLAFIFPTIITLHTCMEVWSSYMGPGDLLSQTFSKTIHQPLDIRKCEHFNSTKKEIHKHDIAPCRIYHLSQKQFNPTTTMYHNWLWVKRSPWTQNESCY